MLFLPGTLCTPAVFEQQIGELDRYTPRVDALHFTLQNSIAEMADLAIAQIPRQSGAAIVGFSMGGMVAMEIARKAPELVRGLALLNTSCQANHSDRQSARIMHLEQARLKGIGSVIKQYYLQHYLYRPHTKAEDLIIKMACELGTECFEAQIEALATRPDLTPGLAGIKCPTLILGATEDRLCPPETQTLMHHQIENSELVMLEACGHFSTLEQPAVVSDKLIKWYQATAVPPNLTLPTYKRD